MKSIPNLTWKITGITDEAFQFVEGFHLTDDIHWRRFVEQFRLHSDSRDKGWKGEFWGKMMRGASLVYAYTKNEELYRVLSNTVNDMIESCDDTGRISTYTKEDEFQGWDIWCRKYVLLGMEYFLEICQEDDLKERIISSMKRQADYILSKIGPEESKRSITTSSIFWRGLSASSILEPMVRLYNLTKEERYLKFAEYIVDCGGTCVANIFQLAYEDKMYPYQYPMTKAYEMISCFEGLLALYKVTGTQWYKEALVHFADKVLESDFTIIGSSGCTHELFDHSGVRQANTNNGDTMQETCVTVTLMKFFYQMTMLTGNSVYADAFERSYYNAYLGALNTEKNIGIDVSKIYNGAYAGAIPGALPFDSYSPLTAGTRGNWIGGVQEMPDHHYYGCCACIGSAGIGLVPKMALMKSDTGFVMNLFLPGTVEVTSPLGQKLTFHIDTEYPKHGAVQWELHMEKAEHFTIALRNPEWNSQTELRVNDKKVEVTKGYTVIDRVFEDGDVISYELDMRTEAIHPISYGSQILMTEMLYDYDYVVPKYDEEDPKAKDHIALRRGPVILAAENRLGYCVDAAFNIAVGEDGHVDVAFAKQEIAPYAHMIEVEVPLTNQEKIHMTDYASAGKTWSEESKMAAWIRTK